MAESQEEQWYAVVIRGGMTAGSPIRLGRDAATAIHTLETQRDVNPGVTFAPFVVRTTVRVVTDTTVWMGEPS